jgi:hypothetical protein
MVTTAHRRNRNYPRVRRKEIRKIRRSRRPSRKRSRRSGSLRKVIENGFLKKSIMAVMKPLMPCGRVMMMVLISMQSLKSF